MSAKHNILKTLGIAASIADVIEFEIHQGEMPKTVAVMVENLRIVMNNAFQKWPYKVSKNDLKRIGNQYDKAQAKSKTLKGEIDLVTFIAMAIGLVVDLESKIKDPSRRQALDNIIRVLERMDKYYSRKQGVDELYYCANEALEVLTDYD